jgi:hypothetical protein
MRLINASTLRLEEFLDGRHAPPYAILSHTWGDGEVTFQDIANLELAKTKKGFGKIEETCKLAKANDIGYAWVDTCCIDKTSSAELTEAINSMFQWYAQSKICYAWLADLGIDQPAEDFASCRWFTRGWTLQELIAPREVEFYDEAWGFRGTKATLSDKLQKVTGIDEEALRVGTIGILSAIPLARRMSWASRRVTTRLEDMAYCLLGIFSVNMPMLYGEGERAFVRLQEEIIKNSNDLSLFAWTLPSDAETGLRDLSLSTSGTSQASRQEHYGILAPSPAYFKDAGDIAPGNGGLFDETYVMTNKGLQIAAELAPLDNATVMPLHCVKSSTGQRVAINLRQYGTRQYARYRADTLVLYTGFLGKAPSWQKPSGALEVDLRPTVFLSKGLTAEEATFAARSCRGGILLGPSVFSKDWHLSAMAPCELFDNSRQVFLTRGQDSFVGYVQVSPLDGTREFLAKLAWVVFGLENGQPWVTAWSTQSLPAGPMWVRDMSTLAKNARGVINDHVILENAHRTRKIKVLVELVGSIVEGEPAYVLNIRRGEV